MHNIFVKSTALFEDDVHIQKVLERIRVQKWTVKQVLTDMREIYAFLVSIQWIKLRKIFNLVQKLLFVYRL